MIDTPKSLGDSRYQAELFARLHEPHVDDLTAFVDRIRRERHCGDAVPYFDPADGDVEAECLLVLEALGPKAVQRSGLTCNSWTARTPVQCS